MSFPVHRAIIPATPDFSPGTSSSLRTILLSLLSSEPDSASATRDRADLARSLASSGDLDAARRASAAGMKFLDFEIGLQIGLSLVLPDGSSDVFLSVSGRVIAGSRLAHRVLSGDLPECTETSPGQMCDGCFVRLLASHIESLGVPLPCPCRWVLGGAYPGSVPMVFFRFTRDSRLPSPCGCPRSKESS